MDEYDVEKAFREIEEELIKSMIRNMKRHRVEEAGEQKQWSMWQAEQLKSLEAYKRKNRKKFRSRFSDINASIDEIIFMARQQGGMDQEIKILSAIQRGYKPPTIPPRIKEYFGQFKGKNLREIAGILLKRNINAETSGEFFKLNTRKLEALIKATQSDFQKAENAILRMADDQYRKVIFNAQVYANTGAGTYEQAVDMATKDFLSRGINCIEYANGARHTISDYADMAIRTAAKRAYLQGEGEMRQEWGISTVIVNKRGNPCPKCLLFVGKVLIDDVWSGGKQSDGPYMLMSYAMSQGLYHPRCKDIHTTYFEGISTPGAAYTREELEQVEQSYKNDQKQQCATRQADKFGRLAKYSLDKDNVSRYMAHERLWKWKTGKGKNADRQYNYHGKNLESVEKEISGLEYEVGVIFDKNGNSIGGVYQKGEEHQVDFGSLMSKMKGGIVTHNHPYSTPPSPEDLYVLKKSKAKELRACGKNGTYVLKYDKSVSELPDYEVFNKDYNDITDELLPVYIERMKKGEITALQGEIQLQEEAWMALSKKYGLDYSFEIRR